ncbi:c-type cytochrome biogenesis protein CcsB [Corynebacterium aquatimens]|uniref:Cytochrome c-type biogenesis protein CcsB n=1 Tax=Corynebacterium aquatimens TaxID=1190508 RepID=A0A931DYG7_9CORY|nr:c-type cytochrome biogenesis protein CcsB [Corynebacterium aquatimens]MBG6122435.1 cytochrome c-type biogenesis protein CcsB [Corynebacterium aquatimens]WJY65025.1 Cytochrome c biogenesis protein CcsA [Corynebacterium aquatimens]
MPVNPTLADISDLTLRTAFAVYVFALILACLYYMRAQTLVDMRRALAASTAKAEHKELVTVGGGRSESSELIDEAPDATDLDAQEIRVRKAAGMTQSLAWLGIAFHLAAVVTRGMSVGRVPFGNLYEYVLTITAVTMVIIAVIIQRKKWHSLWAWILAPIIIVLFLDATVLYVSAAPLVPALQSFWYPFHVSTVSTGASIGLISGIFSLLYLLRIRQPRGEETGVWGKIAKPLPSAKKLDTWAYRTAIITVPLFGIGIMFGAIWGEIAWGRFWNWDPKETVALINWILYAAYLHARATAGWKDQKAAWINIAAFVVNVLNLTVINFFATGLHSYAGLN